MTTTTKETASRLLPYAHMIHMPDHVADSEAIVDGDVFCEDCALRVARELRREHPMDREDIDFNTLEFSTGTAFYKPQTCLECGAKLACRVKHIESVTDGEVWTEEDWDKADEEVSRM
jgi:hypothetical protein